MLGRLSVYIGLAIILGGAVVGAIAAGTGGAISAVLFPPQGRLAVVWQESPRVPGQERRRVMLWLKP